MKLIKFGLPVMLAPVGILVLILGVFFSRSPVLIVSDAGFDALYGPRRTLSRQTGLSLRLFRRVKRVLVAENADPEATFFAIEEGAVKPWAVLGHSRYRQGLERYARQYPDIRLAIIREDSPAGTGPESIFIDTRLNSWRAGRCAAILAGGRGGRVLVFQDGQDFPVNQDAFLAGLREENGALIPLYINSSADYSSWDDVRCVVLGGPGDPYFSRSGEIPAILFTWMDPALSPQGVKIIIDDSPWALAPGALGSSGGNTGGYRSVPSEFTVLRGRVKDRELREKLKKAVHFQIPASLL
ncbi:MAG: hypothetical protein LBU19_11355 [Treponema sp.]|jgi:hypothetical protein|nr:hypothetical protein [Treponema sp.]